MSTVLLRHAPAVVLALLAGTLAATPAPAAGSAAGSAASSVSQSIGVSLGAISGSLKNSSGSSSKAADVAAGDYRVVEIAEAPEPAGAALIALQSEAVAGDEGRLSLTLPREAVEQAALRPGDRVSVQRRPYGLEFASADTGVAFFLVLEDEWMRELQPRPIAS